MIRRRATATPTGALPAAFASRDNQKRPNTALDTYEHPSWLTKNYRPRPPPPPRPEHPAPQDIIKAPLADRRNPGAPERARSRAPQDL